MYVRLAGFSEGCTPGGRAGQPLQIKAQLDSDVTAFLAKELPLGGKTIVRDESNGDVVIFCPSRERKT
jgi:hypothetical protein